MGIPLRRPKKKAPMKLLYLIPNDGATRIIGFDEMLDEDAVKKILLDHVAKMHKTGESEDVDVENVKFSDSDNPSLSLDNTIGNIMYWLSDPLCKEFPCSSGSSRSWWRIRHRKLQCSRLRIYIDIPGPTCSTLRRYVHCSRDHFRRESQRK